MTAWKKAMQQHPEDVETLLPMLVDLAVYGNLQQVNAAARLVEAARVQSVEEAAIAYAQYNEEHRGLDSYGLETWRATEDARLLDAYREARAREAAEKETE